MFRSITAHTPACAKDGTSEAAAEAARILRARQVVPVHFEGWAHFTQGADTLLEAFGRAGLADRLHLLRLGGQIGL
jgi:hypothetical protein